VTGKLVHVGMVNKEIKLQTADGEKVFPLTEQGQKTKGIPDGALVTVELNEAGAVIDVHRASTGSGNTKDPAREPRHVPGRTLFRGPVQSERLI